eukprot:scaffold23306_cov125-Isochrysis_galbana.AAC.9
MCTLPPDELMVMPDPELAQMRFLSIVMCVLFQEEMPSPVAPCMWLPHSTILPPLATTFAPRDEKAMVLLTASSSPR